MDDTCLKLLYDVKSAGDLILSFCEEHTQTDFFSDVMFRSSVERQFEIIGEALYRLRRRYPEIASRISEIDKIIGFRNVLIHGYDAIDSRITWDAVQNKLPQLLSAIDFLIDENPEH